LVSILNLIRPQGHLQNLAGNLNISSNAQLSVCQPDALRTVLASGGWARTYNGGGNLACASPKVCQGTNNSVCL
ncbi:MAG TPA: hypothetical protein VF103_19315, partial [Polyangiaceae bacterium]